jgi:flagellin-like hook-associated protein FlgL
VNAIKTRRSVNKAISRGKVIYNGDNDTNLDIPKSFLSDNNSLKRALKSHRQEDQEVQKKIDSFIKVLTKVKGEPGTTQNLLTGAIKVLNVTIENLNAADTTPHGKIIAKEIAILTQKRNLPVVPGA